MSNDDVLVNEVTEWISKILRKEVDPSNLEASLIDHYEADSMDIVEIVEMMETKYGLNITNQEISQIQTINDVLDKIKSSIV